MLETRAYCVNVLTQGQQDLSNRFAKKGQDKFDGVAWSAGTTGAPVIDDTLVSIECAVSDVIEAGDHHIFCGTVQRLVANESVDEQPLLYYGGRYAAVKAV